MFVDAARRTEHLGGPDLCAAPGPGARRRPRADQVRRRRGGRGAGPGADAWSGSGSSGPRPTTTSRPGCWPSRPSSSSWLDACQPDAVAVERVFSQQNVRTVMGTAQAGAVAIVCAARRGLPVATHTPSEVKAAVTGNGRAGKDQVTTMVTKLLRISDPPRPAGRGRRARAGHLPSVARRRPRWARSLDRRRGQHEEVARDRSCPRHGRRGGARRCRHRGRRRRDAGAVHPGHPGHAQAGGARAGGHLPGGQGGLADPVRLRLRRRAERLRAAADGQRRRPPAGPGHAGRAHARRAAPGRVDRRPRRADHGPGHRQEGGGADRARAAGPARPARRERRRGRPARRPAAAGPAVAGPGAVRPGEPGLAGS